MLVRGEHICVIACISIRGLIDLKICRGGVDSDAFSEFITERLLLQLYPFDGSNPHSVIVLDNCSIHHTSDSVDAMQECGSIVQFLPAYSPDYNPIENIFSKFKTCIRQLEITFPNMDIDELILCHLHKSLQTIVEIQFSAQEYTTFN